MHFIKYTKNERNAALSESGFQRLYRKISFEYPLGLAVERNVVLPDTFQVKCIWHNTLELRTAEAVCQDTTNKARGWGCNSITSVKQVIEKRKMQRVFIFSITHATRCEFLPFFSGYFMLNFLTLFLS